MASLYATAKPQRRWWAIAALAGLLCGAVLGYAVATANSASAPHNVAGPIDIGFSQHMALHHDQAVTLSVLVRGRASGAINSLADTVATGQMQEIGQMKGWLALWGQPQVPVRTGMDWMVPKPQSNSYDPAYVEVCRSTPGGMPGLATIDQLNALRSASGPALDALYLQLLVAHHQGGLPMLRYAAEHAETEVVRQTAGRMLYEQEREVQQMARLLGAHQQLPLQDWRASR
ncbi:MAG: DUF305 domain-containing protein [Pseudomonadota bacterium]